MLGLLDIQCKGPLCGFGKWRSCRPQYLKMKWYYKRGKPKFFSLFLIRACGHPMLPYRHGKTGLRKLSRGKVINNLTFAAFRRVKAVWLGTNNALLLPNE